MDAKITKQRLANFLAYDWLKIILAVALAVAALCVFFTTVQTRPREDQSFEIYGYTGLKLGTDGYYFDKEALEKKIFSYDVLDVTTETFDSSDMYGNTAFGARRAAGQGELMFLPAIKILTERVDENGEKIESTVLDEYIRANLFNAGKESEELKQPVDAYAFMQDCEAYLKAVFGENWRVNNVPNEDVVREYFLARNAKDKRFRTAVKREAGVALERERLISLREAYLKVDAALSSGKIEYATYTSEIGKTYNVGFNLGGNEEDAGSGLPNLHKFIYYTNTLEDGAVVRTARGVTLTVFYNSTATDLRYDTVLFISWLIETYGMQDA